MSFIASATYKFGNPELAQKLFETARDAWDAVLHDLSALSTSDASVQPGFDERLNLMREIAEVIEVEGCVSASPRGHMINVTEVEAYEVASAPGINYASEDELAMVGERVYFVKRVAIWTDVDGNEGDWMLNFNLRKL